VVRAGKNALKRPMKTFVQARMSVVGIVVNNIGFKQERDHSPTITNATKPTTGTSTPSCRESGPLTVPLRSPAKASPLKKEGSKAAVLTEKTRPYWA
jgi:hypothetical protein